MGAPASSGDPLAPAPGASLGTATPQAQTYPAQGGTFVRGVPPSDAASEEISEDGDTLKTGVRERTRHPWDLRAKLGLEPLIADQPGKGEKGEGCGQWMMVIGCLEEEGHELGAEAWGRPRECRERTCPKCAGKCKGGDACPVGLGPHSGGKWAHTLAMSERDRIQGFQEEDEWAHRSAFLRGRGLLQCVLSVPKDRWSELEDHQKVVALIRAEFTRMRARFRQPQWRDLRRFGFRVAYVSTVEEVKALGLDVNFAKATTDGFYEGSSYAPRPYIHQCRGEGAHSTCVRDGPRGELPAVAKDFMVPVDTDWGTAIVHLFRGCEKDGYNLWGPHIHFLIPDLDVSRHHVKGCRHCRESWVEAQPWPKRKEEKRKDPDPVPRCTALPGKKHLCKCESPVTAYFRETGNVLKIVPKWPGGPYVRYAGSKLARHICYELSHAAVISQRPEVRYSSGPKGPRPGCPKGDIKIPGVKAGHALSEFGRLKAWTPEKEEKRDLPEIKCSRGHIAKPLPHGYGFEKEVDREGRVTFKLTTAPYLWANYWRENAPDGPRIGKKPRTGSVILFDLERPLPEGGFARYEPPEDPEPPDRGGDDEAYLEKQMRARARQLRRWGDSAGADALEASLDSSSAQRPGRE